MKREFAVPRRVEILLTVRKKGEEGVAFIHTSAVTKKLEPKAN